MKRVVVLCVMLMAFYIWVIEVAGDETEGTKKVAIIIDDFGHGLEGTEEILSLDIPLTVAVMPFGPHTQEEAIMAYENGHEVIVHLSMEGRPGTSRQLGEGAITTHMSNDEIQDRVHEAIDDVPHAVGINNHMGSVATEDERVMQQVLSVLQDRGLMYVDSKSNYFSVAPDVAEELGVPIVENHIFLDDVANVGHIRSQCHAIKQRLEENEECVAIGHVGRPGKETATALRQWIEEVDDDVEFVTVSELVPEFRWIHHGM
ncbi:polysaccharide deacetylase 2 family uncharacterized protein YibQ [Alkalibacillus filiformis]|uniref:Polysaccharide deacetylase 2 family uncharacterized protein YibQ n=1 Tax=Alkalibacillus filiformis TaxID=200990 RepID=A0ABU0DPM3_9BACI|nr:divergent polysaccharide deacetylase family protein [Alkalibacillus filiformis]MDQ0350367.1 polysaccharide deacetylase 2 family uncharacterized protein YibQ [Alkalibacillus filiformis]